MSNAASDTHDHGPPPSANPSAHTARTAPVSALAKYMAQTPKSSIDAVCGALGGVASGIVTCPLDVIKTKLQAQGGFRQQQSLKNAPSSSAIYHGMVGTARSIARQDGVRGFYRGLSPMLLGYFPTWGVYMSVYGIAKDFYYTEIDNKFVAQMASSVTAGACSTLATNPIWVIKTRLMAQASRDAADNARTPWHYTSTLDAARKMYAAEGVAAFYSGLSPALLGLTHVAIQFPLYEYFKKEFTGVEMGQKSDGKPSANTLGSLAASFLSKVCATTATYPHEVLRTRLQTQQRMYPGNSHDDVAHRGSHGYSGRRPPGMSSSDGMINQPRYKGVIRTCKIILAEEGWRAFYNGLGTNLIRAVPAAMTTMLTYETLKDACFRLQDEEFNERGDVTLVHGEFKKSELIAKVEYGLLARDLRKIDSSSLPHISVRPSAILINLLHIRCLIKHNRVLLFDAYGSTDSYTQSVFMYDLEGKLRQQDGELPYEFRALEAVLISVTAGLEGEFEGVREPVVKVLRELEEDIDRDKLRHLLIYSKKLGTFEQKARLVRDAIDDLLEADDDLAAMYLTEKADGKERAEDDHTEVEMLLESYYKICDEIVQISGNLVSNIRNTEEIVRAILDANRNSLMLLDLRFSILTLGIGAGTFIAALYGMNLKNFIEESDLGFGLVSLSCAVLTVVSIIYGLRKLRRVQRLSMWGEGSSLDQGGVAKGPRGRGSWREVDPQGQLSGENRVERIVRWKEEQRRSKMQEASGEGDVGAQAHAPVTAAAKHRKR